MGRSAHVLGSGKYERLCPIIFKPSYTVFYFSWRSGLGHAWTLCSERFSGPLRLSWVVYMVMISYPAVWPESIHSHLFVAFFLSMIRLTRVVIAAHQAHAKNANKSICTNKCFLPRTKFSAYRAYCRSKIVENRRYAQAIAPQDLFAPWADCCRMAICSYDSLPRSNFHPEKIGTMSQSSPGTGFTRVKGPEKRSALGGTWKFS